MRDVNCIASCIANYYTNLQLIKLRIPIVLIELAAILGYPCQFADW